jgi:transposase-like protein
MERSSKRGKIPPQDWPSIITRYQSGETLASIARTYDCSPPAISYIVSRSRARNAAAEAQTTAPAQEPQLVKSHPAASPQPEAASEESPEADSPAAASAVSAAAPRADEVVAEVAPEVAPKIFPKASVERADPARQPEELRLFADDPPPAAPLPTAPLPLAPLPIAALPAAPLPTAPLPTTILPVATPAAALPVSQPPSQPLAAQPLASQPAASITARRDQTPQAEDSAAERQRQRPRDPAPNGNGNASRSFAAPPPPNGEPRRTLHLSLTGGDGGHRHEPQPPQSHGPAVVNVGERNAAPPATAPATGGQAARQGMSPYGQAGNGAPLRTAQEPHAANEGGSFIDQALRERVDGDIAAFLTAFDAALDHDTAESRAGLREATDRLLRAGARTRIELERLEARVPLVPRDKTGPEVRSFRSR